MGELETGAVEWLVDALPRCSITSGGAAGTKALLDLALLLAIRARTAPKDPANVAMFEHVRQQASSPAYTDLLASNKSLVNYYGLAYLAVRAMGAECAAGGVVRDIMRSGLPIRTARPPHRVLDVLFFARQLSMPVESPTTEEVLATTLLAVEPKVRLVTEQDQYAMAHTVFYATDFGWRDTAWPRPQRAVQNVLSILLGRAVESGNVDLAAELCCACTCLPLESGGFGMEQFADLLAASVRADGSFPRYLRYSSATGAGPDWREAHHATVVVALALTLARTLGQIRA
jgi:hypothetical protein